jgi:hypothetical protein
MVHGYLVSWGPQRRSAIGVTFPGKYIVGQLDLLKQRYETVQIPPAQEPAIRIMANALGKQVVSAPSKLSNGLISWFEGGLEVA